MDGKDGKPNCVIVFSNKFIYSTYGIYLGGKHITPPSDPCLSILTRYEKHSTRAASTFVGSICVMHTHRRTHAHTHRSTHHGHSSYDISTILLYICGACVFTYFICSRTLTQTHLNKFTARRALASSIHSSCSCCVFFPSN